MRRYITQDEIDTIEFRIYNNLPPIVDEDISETDEGYRFTTNEKNAKALAKGKEYIALEEDERYIITKEGRIYNTHRLNGIKPSALSTDLMITISNQHKVYYSELFKRAGWEWDYPQILLNYKNNNWGIVMHDPARRLLQQHL